MIWIRIDSVGEDVKVDTNLVTGNISHGEAVQSLFEIKKFLFQK